MCENKRGVYVSQNFIRENVWHSPVVKLQASIVWSATYNYIAEAIFTSRPCRLSMFAGGRHDTLPGDAGGLGAAGPAAEHRRRRGLRDRAGRERQSAAVRRRAVRGGGRRGRAPGHDYPAGDSRHRPRPPRREHRSHLHTAAPGKCGAAAAAPYSRSFLFTADRTVLYMYTRIVGILGSLVYICARALLMPNIKYAAGLWGIFRFFS